MVAVATKERRAGRDAAAGVEVNAHVPGQEPLLPPAALALLAGLHRRFEPVRQARLQARRNRQAFFDAGGLPDFRADTAAIRAGDWRVAALPAALLDRRVEITGPTDPKTVINALNSGANCFMADFEDSTSPTWSNLLTGQRALKRAVAGTLDWMAPDGSRPAANRHYTLKAFAQQAVLMVRPRGWHLDEKHVRVDGEPISASLFDLGLFAFHNAGALSALDRGPYFYLPKLQSMEEAQLWNDVLDHVEQALGLAPSQIRVTVLIETLPAAFEMDEILHALRTRIAGLNCGRWDYIFSYIKTFRAHRDKVLPERGQLTMAQPFLHAYADLLIHTCHRRGAHAMGGMAAQIPIRGDDAASVDANNAALAKVGADKLREVGAGFDGTWVAHPALIGLAKAIFDEAMPGPHQQQVRREDVLELTPEQLRDALVKPAPGTITRGGFDGNVEVCVRYLAAWLDGNGCVPIHGLMEDAATAEIARTQLWQWLHPADPPVGHVPPGDGLHLDDGTPVDFALLERALLALPGKLAGHINLPGAGRINDAIALLDALSHADTLEDFLTLPAYACLD